MSTDTLTIFGKQYNPTPSQQMLIRQAHDSLLSEIERIECEDSGPHNSLNNAGDPYREPALRYQNRVCEIMGVS